MKNIQPSADLPPANSHIMLTCNSLPARPHRVMARNKTGIYLGSNMPLNSPRPYHSVPPLAKPRGTLFRPQTPLEKRRRANTVPGQMVLEQGQPQRLPQVTIKQVLMSDDPDCLSSSLLYIYHHPNPAPMALPYTPPMILHLPILRPKQQQRVEVLRIREEPRGFHPQPVRKAKPKSKPDETLPLPVNNSEQTPVLRKSARNFVAAANSGITHLEDLGLEELSLRSAGIAGRESSLPPSVIEDIQCSNKKMVGLEECYNKICKGNLASLQCLLPGRKPVRGLKGIRTTVATAPLTIRSFRNPRSPHSVVQYSDLKNRNKTPTTAKPPVPAPYYYSSRGLPSTSDDGGSKVRLTHLPASSRSTERILAGPGVGAISHSAHSRRTASLPTSNPPQGVEGVPPPSRSSNTKFVELEDHYPQKNGFQVPSSSPTASTTSLHKIIGNNSSLPQELTNKMSPTPPPLNLERPCRPARPSNGNISYSIPTGQENRGSISESVASDPDSSKLIHDYDEQCSETSNRPSMPAVSIVVSLETEGESRVMDLEESGTEAECKGDVQQPIQQAENEQFLQDWHEASEKKQEQLQRLLSEHQEIISHIEKLERIKDDQGQTDSVEEGE